MVAPNVCSVAGVIGCITHFADIHRRAKEKRERLRSAHLAPDYIPLGGAAGLTATSNQQAAARLRNQQADGSNSEEEEEAEDGVRMQFVGGVRPSGARSVPRGAEGGQVSLLKRPSTPSQDVFGHE